MHIDLLQKEFRAKTKAKTKRFSVAKLKKKDFVEPIYIYIYIYIIYFLLNINKSTQNNLHFRRLLKR